MAALTPTYDGTAPAAHERVQGPGNPRLAHAYPDNSNVALCGALKTGERQQAGRKCPECVRESRRRSWVAR